MSRAGGEAHPPPARFIVATRGSRVESRHRVHAVVSDGERLLASFGDPDLPVWYRSACKILQALAVVRSGAADRFQLSARELAIACGSHSGTPEHTAVVAGMLARGGLAESDLRCGTHPPLSEAAAAALAASGERPTQLHHNCSGKHAAMLLRCVHEGWPTADYISPGHPHQVEIRSIIGAFAGLPAGEVGVAIDGCSAPVFGVTLAGMARSCAWIARGQAPGGTADAGLVRVREAALAHPVMVAGEGRLDTELMRAAAGEYVTKIGAEAVYCVSRPGAGLGMAFKVEDGAMRAVDPAFFDLARELGWPVPSGLERFERPVLRNYRDLEVGELRPEHPPGGHPEVVK